ncbi:MAG TPA: helix-turn-helix domain-containing protein [Ktedonobacteraceae bacterium]
MQSEITQPLLITVEETMRLIRLGRTKIYALIRQEGLPVHRFGRRVLVDPDELKSWLVLRRERTN